eukprot:1590184-Amphidinium_carterae.1
MGTSEKMTGSVLNMLSAVALFQSFELCCQPGGFSTEPSPQVNEENGWLRCMHVQPQLPCKS